MTRDPDVLAKVIGDLSETLLWAAVTIDEEPERRRDVRRVCHEAVDKALAEVAPKTENS